MSEIKIFVSHRIDIESELINNPIYVPVRCGAVFDDKNPMHILGDDTGEHISERRMSLQYSIGHGRIGMPTTMACVTTADTYPSRKGDLRPTNTT